MMPDVLKLFTETYMNYPLVTEELGDRLNLEWDDSDTMQGKVPQQKVKPYGDLSTAGWTPKTFGKITSPSSLSEYYLVEWYQSGDHPITLVHKDEYTAILYP